ncbi:MAG: hypothetical protein U0U67_16780 [Chitinophagales bacterium]
MKKILFFSLILMCTISFACHKKKKNKAVQTTKEVSGKLNSDEVWMQYDETKCENPWQFNWFTKPTEEQILAAVKSDLSGKEITVLEIRSTTEKDFISCDACTCPNGTHYFVRVNKSEIEKLKALKFFEMKEIPKTESTDKTK